MYSGYLESYQLSLGYHVNRKYTMSFKFKKRRVVLSVQEIRDLNITNSSEWINM